MNIASSPLKFGEHRIRFKDNAQPDYAATLKFEKLCQEMEAQQISGMKFTKKQDTLHFEVTDPFALPISWSKPLAKLKMCLAKQVVRLIQNYKPDSEAKIEKAKKKMKDKMEKRGAQKFIERLSRESPDLTNMLISEKVESEKSV